MEAIGAAIEEVSLPGYSLLRAVHNTVAAVEASSSAGKYDSVRFGHRAPQGRNWNEMYLASRGESFRLPVKAFLFQALSSNSKTMAPLRMPAGYGTGWSGRPRTFWGASISWCSQPVAWSTTRGRQVRSGPSMNLHADPARKRYGLACGPGTGVRCT
jgi:hypothetical protein